ncbi:poly [ADP-ribose] polymerase tankyrase-1-like isoform X2 [Schistocerca gregaria]|uniref:poly [ADP-ribose] polymerase tankyrase-1-like isoform X2 n=1 Tax=Schistocerca gregaria TaxID=7010 RepID=UPI00211EB053|nr:poly [ADP-ribose] polymerase tankyrase-1-like isoform X2 [Schistocerca gregaria]XP_049853779.1 poly [ADP-ribose] polymerase tankyrase-1-like isoform X2 [Schistocerca gregaria]
MSYSSISWLICIFVVVAAATDYSDVDSIRVQEVREWAAVPGAADGAVVSRLSASARLLVGGAGASALRPGAPDLGSPRATLLDVDGRELRRLLAAHRTLQAPRVPSAAPQYDSSADCALQAALPLSVEAAAAVAVLAVRYSCTDLRDAALAFVRAHIFDVMASQGWADVMRTHTEDLIRVSQLLSEPPAVKSTPASTEVSTAHWPNDEDQTPLPDDDGAAPADVSDVSPFRSLSGHEKCMKLIEAAKQGRVEELRALLEAGADIDGKDIYGRTALHTAAWNRHVEAVRTLLYAGADVSARDNEEYAPLHMAALGGSAAVVRLLAEFSADPNARDVWGWTPLHLAAREGQPEAAQALLDTGADSGAREHTGLTPLDIARSRNQQEVAEVLTRD